MTAIGLPIDCFPRRGKRVAPFRDSSKRPAGRSADIQIVVRLANCSQRRLEMTTPPLGDTLLFVNRDGRIKTRNKAPSDARR
ncbi:MAG: hypothetical protein CMJ59_00930 [Planctomycetaceae bacterium]|nr:hypothetical protein [Planctomycetaceae bacterium]